MDAYIGVGHGLRPDGVFDPGATSGDLIEHDLAVSVVDAYADAMRASGIDLEDESHSGSGHDPNFIGSARRANELRVRYADEVHFNAGGGTGVEVLVHPRSSAANKKACRAVAVGIAKVLGLPVRRDRGLFLATGFGFLTGTNMPSAIIEVAFLDTAADRRAIRRKDALEDVGAAIAEARCAFLGVTNTPPAESDRGVPIAAGRPTADRRGPSLGGLAGMRGGLPRHHRCGVGTGGGYRYRRRDLRGPGRQGDRVREVRGCDRCLVPQLVRAEDRHGG